jgi:hypothetical protein
MRSRRGLARAVTIVLLLLAVGVVSVAIVSAAALPLALAVGVAVMALVVGVGTRLTPRAVRRRRRRSPPVQHAGKLGGTADTSPPGSIERHWVTQWETGPSASAVASVRNQLAVELAEWGLTGEASEPTLLVVTELVSNSVQHGQAPVRLLVQFPGESVRVEVHDAAAEPPRLQPRDPHTVRGRGLQIVEAVSAQWGWTNGTVGKIVWAQVPIGWPD